MMKFLSALISRGSKKGLSRSNFRDRQKSKDLCEECGKPIGRKPKKVYSRDLLGNATAVSVDCNLCTIRYNEPAIRELLDLVKKQSKKP